MQNLQVTTKLSTRKSIYDKTFVNNELKDMLEQLRSDETILTKVKLFEKRSYSNKKFSEWNGKFSNNPRTQELINKIDEILESRLVSKGLNSNNYGFIIFLLKNHYGYADKRETDSTVSHTFTVSRGDISPSKAKKVLKGVVTLKPNDAQ